MKPTEAGEYGDNCTCRYSGGRPSRVAGTDLTGRRESGLFFMPALLPGGMGHTTIEHERRTPIAGGNQRKDHSPYTKTEADAQQLQKAMKALLAQMKKQHDRQKIPHGKQTLKQLMKQNAGVSTLKSIKDNIKAFESTVYKKYGIDFALKKDSTETPPRYLVFFKGRDADALTAAKEFSAKKLTQEQKPPIRKLIVSKKRRRLNTQRDAK